MGRNDVWIEWVLWAPAMVVDSSVRWGDLWPGALEAPPSSPHGRAVRWGALAILAFLAFITAVGFGFPTAGVIEDIVQHRIIAAVMAVLVLPLLWPRTPSRRNTSHTSYNQHQGSAPFVLSVYYQE